MFLIILFNFLADFFIPAIDTKSPNGAGKTTLIRIINRITAPDTGCVLLGDREIQPEDIYRIGFHSVICG